MKVVIVEDDFIAAEFLKEILEEYGHEVMDIVDTGKEAIHTCIKKEPDAIFMDVMLADNISGADASISSRKHLLRLRKSLTGSTLSTAMST